MRCLITCRNIMPKSSETFLRSWRQGALFDTSNVSKVFGWELVAQLISWPTSLAAHCFRIASWSPMVSATTAPCSASTWREMRPLKRVSGLGLERQRSVFRVSDLQVSPGYGSKKSIGDHRFCFTKPGCLTSIVDPQPPVSNEAFLDELGFLMPLSASWLSRRLKWGAGKSYGNEWEKDIATSKYFSYDWCMQSWFAREQQSWKRKWWKEAAGNLGQLGGAEVTFLPTESNQTTHLVPSMFTVSESLFQRSATWQQHGSWF